MFRCACNVKTHRMPPTSPLSPSLLTATPSLLAPMYPSNPSNLPIQAEPFCVKHPNELSLSPRPSLLPHTLASSNINPYCHTGSANGLPQPRAMRPTSLRSKTLPNLLSHHASRSECCAFDQWPTSTVRFAQHHPLAGHWYRPPAPLRQPDALSTLRAEQDGGDRLLCDKHRAAGRGLNDSNHEQDPAHGA
jgi:hypothetical protein